MRRQRCEECGAYVEILDAPPPGKISRMVHWSTGRCECGPQVRRNDALVGRPPRDVLLYGPGHKLLP